MKTVYTLLVTLFLTFSLTAQDWEQVQSLPTSFRKHHPVTFSIDGIGYSITGTNTSENSTDTGRKYDPATDQWSDMVTFPGPPRGFSYGLADGEYGYMGFGYNSNNGQYLDDLWKFDPADESWEELASCPCEPRYHPAFIHTNGKIFIGLGSSAIGNLDDWWEYDITSNSWTQHQNFPGPPRHHPFYFDINGIAYVGFGHGNGIFNDFYKFDPSSNSWTELNDFPGEARVAGTQFSHEGNGYVLSGDGDDHDYMLNGEFWKYTAEDDSWTQLPNHPGLSKWAPGSFVIDGKVYLMQGLDRFLNQFPGSELSNEVYRFDLDTYHSVQELSRNNDDFTLALYPNPASNFIKINVSDFSVKTAQVSIHDFTGKLVYENNLQNLSEEINVEHLSSGLYSIQVLSDKQTGNIQFLKN